MSLWVTFIGGVIAYKTLPRHQFGTLQHQTFPIYFALSIALSLSMLVMWTSSHPDVLSHILQPNVADVAQAYALLSVTLSQAANYFVISPLASITTFKRHKLEKEEGKLYTDPSVSVQMKALNRRFAMLHGISSLANLTAFIALSFHGLWLGNYGVLA